MVLLHAEDNVTSTKANATLFHLFIVVVLKYFKLICEKQCVDTLFDGRHLLHVTMTFLKAISMIIYHDMYVLYSPKNIY